MTDTPIKESKGKRGGQISWWSGLWLAGRKGGLSVATADSMGVQFLIQAVSASMRLHSCRYEHRQEFFLPQYPHMSTIRQWLHALLDIKRNGK